VLAIRWLGGPVFVLVMWGVFVAAARLAEPLRAGLAALIDGPVATVIRSVLDMARLGDTWVAGLVVDGLLAGVGQLLTFVCGYLARAARVADRLHEAGTTRSTAWAERLDDLGGARAADGYG
jgi:ferrous iron transport protein B